MSTEEGTQEQEPSTEPTTVIEVPKPEPADEGDTEPALKNGPTRDEKKHARGLGLREIRENSERQSAELRAMIAQQNEALAEMRGRMAATQERTQERAPDPSAAIKDKIAALRAEADAALSVAAADGTSPAIARSQMNRYQDLQEQIMDMRADARTEAKLNEFRQSMPQGQREPEQAMMESEFPWIATNARALEWAKGAERQLLAEGRPATIATSREALAAAAVKFSLGGNPLPRQAPNGDRRYAGMPSTRGSDDGEPTRVALSAKDMEVVRSYAATRGLSLDEAKKAVARMLVEK